MTNFSSPDNSYRQDPEDIHDSQQQTTIRMDINPVRPWVSYTFLAVTIFVFLLQLASQAILNNDLPVVLAAKFNQMIRQGEFWRLITPILLHGSFAHIAFNMYALFIIGPGLERYYGHIRFLALYLLAGFAGNVASFIFSPNPSLGASTSIFGLVAAQAIFIYRNRNLYGQNARQLLINVGMIIVINLFLGLSPRIDNWGHMGGLIGGLVFAWFAGPRYHLTGFASQLVLQEEEPGISFYLVAFLLFLFFAALVALNL